MKSRAFTLVEMLVVIAIIMAVAVVTLPAITSLSKSSARRTAISLTMSALDQARGLALARSTPHYLVFADTDVSWPERLRQRSFAIFEETYNPQSESYTRQIVGTWTPLPDGIAFRKDADTVFAAAGGKFYCHPLAREMELPYVRFVETGAVDHPAESQFARLRLFEGFFNEAGEAIVTNPADATAQESIKVSLQTGRAQRETSHAAN